MSPGLMRGPSFTSKFQDPSTLLGRFGRVFLIGVFPPLNFGGLIPISGLRRIPVYPPALVACLTDGGSAL